jgi:hypothetical protein
VNALEIRHQIAARKIFILRKNKLPPGSVVSKNEYFREKNKHMSKIFRRGVL